MIYIKYAACEESDNKSLSNKASLLRRELLCSLFGEKYNDAEIANAPGGKPYIPGAPFDFSDSHTKGAVAVAACGKGKIRDVLILIEKDISRIGVDIECADRVVKNKDVIIKKLFSTKEKEYINTDKNKRFLEVWTKKESIVKATGEGLAGIRRADTLSFNGKHLETRYITIGDKEYIISVAGI